MSCDETLQFQVFQTVVSATVGQTAELVCGFTLVYVACFHGDIVIDVFLAQENLPVKSVTKWMIPVTPCKHIFGSRCVSKGANRGAIGGGRHMGRQK